MKNNSSRFLTESESYLIKFLFPKLENQFLEKIPVLDMNEGMGSLYFPKINLSRNERYPISILNEILIKDLDGVDILITLFLDNSGDLFELDIWKVDFNKPSIVYNLEELKEALKIGTKNIYL